jgi:hypothetical protein
MQTTGNGAFAIGPARSQKFFAKSGGARFNFSKVRPAASRLVFAPARPFG